MKKITIFSAITGLMFEIEADEVNTLAVHHIPLKTLPSKSCRRCYGRMHIGYNEATRSHIPCPACARKCIDAEAAKTIIENHKKKGQ